MSVVELVERERAGVRRLHTAAGLTLAAAATCVVLGLGAWALGEARWISLPRGMPFVVWALVAVADLAVVRWTWRRLTTDGARSSVAAAIERDQSLRTGALRGVIEVADQSALGRHAAERLGAQLGPERRRALAPSIQRGARRAALATAVALAIGVAALTRVTPAFGDGLRAILRPMHAWRGTLVPRLGFRDLPTDVLRGERLTLAVDAPGRATVQVMVRATGEGWRTLAARVNPRTGRATLPVGVVGADLMVVATDGRTSTDTAVVRATDRPFVGAVSMRAIYPGYLGRAGETLPVGEAARVPRGTRIEIGGRASTPLTSVRLTSGSDTTSLAARGRAFDGRIVAERSGRWTWVAAGVGGPIADVPLPLDLDVVPDSAPRVEIVAPGTDTLIVPESSLTLRAQASDDHGLATIEVRSWRQPASGREQPVLSARLATAQPTAWSGETAIDLATRGLQPGDVLHVKVVATDNSPWAQTGESRELLLRVPTAEERRATARATADSAVQAATSAAQAQKALEQKTEEAARDRGQRQGASTRADSPRSGASGRNDQSMSYDAAEKARGVAQEQRALVDRVKQLQQTAQQLEQQLRQAGAMDTSLARQLRDAQQLLRDALTPELMAQMQKLEQAAKQLSGDQAREAMKDLAAMQQKLREQLEKSADMLRRAALEGAMQTLHDEAKEIAQRERQLADSAQGAPSEGERADAKELGDRSKRFEQELQKLQERLEREKAQEGATQTAEARKRADESERTLREALGEEAKGDAQKQEQGEAEKGDAQKSEAQKSDGQKGEARRSDAKQGDTPKSGAEKVDSAGSRMPSGNEQSSRTAKSGQSAQGKRSSQGGRSPQSAGSQQQQGGSLSEGAREASQQMDQAAQAMQNARDQQVSTWKQELTQELDRSIQETLQMARDEGAMEQKLRSGGAQSQDMRGQQSALEQGVEKTNERLQQQSRKTSLLSGRSQRAMSEAQQKVSQATQQMREGQQREGQQRGGQQQQAASALGEAAEALNRAAASLARDREKANSASSASGFSEMLQQMQELAKKQGAVNGQAQGLMPMPGGQMSPGMQATARALARQQRQIAESLDEMGDNVGGDKAAQLAREARQLADAMDASRLDATTLARQQQLFRRLLDAGRSLEKDEHDDPNKREAKAATGAEAQLPENATASGRSATRFREPTWDELRGLSADERRAILDYFKRINAQSP